jgi:hypothetical protein
MHHNIRLSTLFDKTLWIGKLTGYRVQAFGREQVLKTPIEIHIRQEWINPVVWAARAYPGDHEPCAGGRTAEDCMAKVETLFTTVLEPWQAYTEQSLFGRVPMKPTLVHPRKRRTG